MNTMFENLYACKELHSILFYSICEKYNLTIAEILVLLYLAGAKGNDTAKDIVDKLKPVSYTHLNRIIAPRHIDLHEHMVAHKNSFYQNRGLYNGKKLI